MSRTSQELQKILLSDNWGRPKSLLHRLLQSVREFFRIEAKFYQDFPRPYTPYTYKFGSLGDSDSSRKMQQFDRGYIVLNSEIKLSY